MKEILTSQAVLALLGLLTAYFGIKLLALVVSKWTPRSRALTLDAEQLKGWRITAALGTAGMACLWLGLLLALALDIPQCYLLTAAGAVVYAAFKVRMVKKYPYIDPSTVKKGGKKKKKK